MIWNRRIETYRHAAQYRRMNMHGAEILQKASFITIGSDACFSCEKVPSKAVTF